MVFQFEDAGSDVPLRAPQGGWPTENPTVTPAPAPWQPRESFPSVEWQGFKPYRAPGATSDYYWPSFELKDDKRAEPLPGSPASTNYAERKAADSRRARANGGQMPTRPTGSRTPTPYNLPPVEERYSIQQVLAGLGSNTAPTSFRSPGRPSNVPDISGSIDAARQRAKPTFDLYVTEDNPAVYYGWGGTESLPGDFIYHDYNLDDQTYYVSDLEREKLGRNDARPTYRIGSEQNLPFVESWTPQQFADFRGIADYINQFYDVYSAPLGQNPGDWTEGDQEAMRWFMGYANWNGLQLGNPSAPSASGAFGALIGLADSGELAVREDAPGGGGASSAPPPLEKQVQTTIGLSDIDRARQLLMDQMRSRLGRDPSDSEVRKFLGALNAAERANPSVTTTTATAWDDYNRVTESTSVTEPGNVDDWSMVEDRLPEGELQRFTGARVINVMKRLAGL